jgi:hypothetical protein
LTSWPSPWSLAYFLKTVTLAICEWLVTARAFIFLLTLKFDLLFTELFTCTDCPFFKSQNMLYGFMLKIYDFVYSTNPGKTSVHFSLNWLTSILKIPKFNLLEIYRNSQTSGCTGLLSNVHKDHQGSGHTLRIFKQKLKLIILPVSSIGEGKFYWRSAQYTNNLLLSFWHQSEGVNRSDYKILTLVISGEW